MAWLGTLLKIGIAAAALGGVVYGARRYNLAQQKRLAASPKKGELPPLDDAPGTDCSTWGPLFDEGGTIRGYWVPGAQGQPICVPSCVEGFAPERTGEGDYDWACTFAKQPEPPPSEFPPPDACVVQIYSRSPLPPEHGLYESAVQETKIALKDLRMNLVYRAQTEIMLAMLERIQQEPSVRSVMVRRTLEDLAPRCDWWIDDDAMRPSQRLVYQSALALAEAAEIELGWDHPQTARKNMVPREWLGVMSTGPLQLVPGQHVEILVVEGPQMEFGEHVIAKTLSGGSAPKVVVVPTFRGVDVAPRFGPHHGFNVGTQVVLESSPPTSAYRVYPKEWQS